MWNPDLPMKPLLDDFFAGFYGAGAPFVREYFEELHRLQIAYTSADTNRWLNCHQDIPSPDIPVEFWDRADLVPGRDGQAVTIGIYDPKTKKYGCSGAYRTGQLSADYAWYDVGEFDPSDLTPRAYVYVGDGYRDKDGNRCADALYLDCLQFAEAK